MNKNFLFFLFFLLLISPSYAIIIGPASENIEYVAGKNISLDYRFSNTDKDVDVSISGFLEDFVSFEPFIESCDKFCTTRINFTIPETETPGNKRTFVCVRNHIAQGTGLMQIIPKVCSRIDIFVPYPGQYAEIMKINPEPKAYNYKIGQKLYFNNVVKNLGGEYISSVSGVTYITGTTNNYFKAINFIPSSLEISEEKTFTALFDTTEMERGLYTVNSTIYYGDGSHSKKMYTIQVGDKFVEVVNMDTINFYSNKINKAKFSLKNYWPEPLKTYIDAKLFNGSIEISSSESKTVLVNTNGFVEGYVDLTGVPIGNYTLTATSHFADGLTNSKTFPIQVVIVPEDYVESEESSFFNMGFSPMILMFGVMLFLIILLLVVVVFMLIKRK